MKTKRVIPMVVAGLLAATAAFAQRTGDVVMSDKQFARTVAQGSAAQVSMSRVAESRATHSEVQRFARKIVRDHSRGNDMLMDLAERRGWRLPNTPDRAHRATVRRVSRLGGSAFDRAYMQAMLRDHGKTVGLVRAYAQSGRDPELRAWARRALPVLIEHHRMARSTAQEVI